MNVLRKNSQCINGESPFRSMPVSEDGDIFTFRLENGEWLQNKSITGLASWSRFWIGEWIGVVRTAVFKHSPDARRPILTPGALDSIPFSLTDLLIFLMAFILLALPGPTETFQNPGKFSLCSCREQTPSQRFIFPLSVYKSSVWHWSQSSPKLWGCGSRFSNSSLNSDFLQLNLILAADVPSLLSVLRAPRKVYPPCIFQMDSGVASESHSLST